MNKKQYMIPMVRFIAPRFEDYFLASPQYGGSTIDDVTEEEWTL